MQQMGARTREAATVVKTGGGRLTAIWLLS